MKRFKIIAKIDFYDIDEGRLIKRKEEYFVSEERAIKLIGLNYVELLEIKRNLVAS